MLTSHGVKKIAGELSRMEKRTDPALKGDLQQLAEAQLGFVAEWIEGLRAFEAMPGSSRLELDCALDSIKRAAHWLRLA